MKFVCYVGAKLPKPSQGPQLDMISIWNMEMQPRTEALKLLPLILPSKWSLLGASQKPMLPVSTFSEAGTVRRIGGNSGFASRQKQTNKKKTNI